MLCSAMAFPSVIKLQGISGLRIHSSARVQVLLENLLQASPSKTNQILCCLRYRPFCANSNPHQIDCRQNAETLSILFLLPCSSTASPHRPPRLLGSPGSFPGSTACVSKAATTAPPPATARTSSRPAKQMGTTWMPATRRRRRRPTTPPRSACRHRSPQLHRTSLLLLLLAPRPPSPPLAPRHSSPRPLALHPSL
jgi:hypothetical protein